MKRASASAAAKPSGYTNLQIMRMAWKVLAGGTLLSALLACVAHDDTNFATPPQPGDAASPTRTVVDSGVVTIPDDAGGGVIGIGGTGEYTPDAAVLPDSSPDLATAELGGIGSICDLFGTNNSIFCGLGNGCYPNPANGTGTCQTQQGRALAAGVNCIPDSTSQACGPQLICNPNYVCANLCHYGSSAAVVNADCGDSIGAGCSKWAGSDTIGYCD